MAGEDDELLLRFDIVDDPAIRALEQVSDASVKASERAAAAAEKAALRASERAQDAAIAAQKASEKAAKAAARAVEDGSAAAKRAAESAAIASEKAAQRATRANKDAAEKMAAAWEKADHARQLALRRTQLTGAGAAGGTSFGDISKQLNQNQLVSDLEQVSAIFIQFGGTVSKVAAVTTSLIRPLTLVGTVAASSTTFMSGLVGAGVALIGPAAFGIAAKVLSEVAGAIYQLGEDALKAEERLRKMGLAAAIPIETLTALENYREAQGLLARSSDEFTVQLSSRFLPALEELTLTAAVVTDNLTKYADAIAMGVVEGVVGANTVWTFEAAMKALNLVLGDQIELRRQLLDFEHGTTKASKEAAAANNTAVQAKKDLAWQDQVLADWEREYEAELKKSTQAAKEAADAAERLSRARAAAVSTKNTGGRSQGIQSGVSAAQQGDWAALVSGAQTAADVFDGDLRQAIQAATIDLEAMNEPAKSFNERLGVAAGKLAKINQLIFEGGEAWKDGAGAFAGEVGKSVQGIQAIFEPYAEAIGLAYDMAAETATEAMDVVRKHHDRVMDLKAREREADTKAQKERIAGLIYTEEFAERQAKRAARRAKKEALELWRLDRAAKISQAVMAGFLAISQAYAQLGPIAATIALPGVVAATSLQVASIAKQKPPTFHTGGVVGDRTMAADEQNVRALSGEGVVSRRGMATLGRDGLAALNGGGPIVVETTNIIQIDGRELARFVSTKQVTPSSGRGGRRNIHAERG